MGLDKEDKTHTAQLLAAWQRGDTQARDGLFEMLYDELAAIASLLLRREQQPISLVTGDLVSEAIVRLLQSDESGIVDKSHLLALSARMMRHVLLDAVRYRNRDKRKGIRVTLNEAYESPESSDIDLVALDFALTRLRAIDPKRADVAEMRYFGGMTVEEIAAVLDLSPATVKRIWSATRLWLKKALRDDE